MSVMMMMMMMMMVMMVMMINVVVNRELGRDYVHFLQCA
jgi:hypothetical protein